MTNLVGNLTRKAVAFPCFVLFVESTQLRLEMMFTISTQGRHGSTITSPNAQRRGNRKLPPTLARIMIFPPR